MRAILLAALAGFAAAPSKENSASDRAFAEVIVGQRKRKPRNPNKGRWGRLVPVRTNPERRFRRLLERTFLAHFGRPMSPRTYVRYRKGLLDLQPYIGTFKAEFGAYLKVVFNG